MYHIFGKLSSISLATPRPDYCHTCSQSRNHLNRTCLTKWSRPKDPQKPDILLRSKEIHKQMWNNSGKGYKAISKAVTKDQRTTSKELQASLASVKVSVYDSTLRKRQGKNGLHGQVPRRKPLFSKRNIKARLSFDRKHLDEPQDFWENTLWTHTHTHTHIYIYKNTCSSVILYSHHFSQLFAGFRAILWLCQLLNPVTLMKSILGTSCIPSTLLYSLM